MSIHLESAFETEVCEVLGSHGWLNDDGSAAHDVRKLGLLVRLPCAHGNLTEHFSKLVKGYMARGTTASHVHQKAFDAA